MALTTYEIANHPGLHGSIRQQSRALLAAYETNPRLGSVFATQQRWLMAHSALSLFFRRGSDIRGGFNAARFFDLIRQHGVASRNTADAFLKEMLKYNFARYSANASGDRRIRDIEPTQPSLEALHGWAAAHLMTLDSMDGGSRAERYLATPDALGRLQPLIADGLLTSKPIREPAKTFSLFTWLNNGGVVMDWLIAGIEPMAPEADRVPTGVLSIADMAGWLKLSRTHLARKLHEAEAMGSIGWEGKRGRSVMWVSNTFRMEYAAAQATKLAIVDAAFDACFRGAPADTVKQAKAYQRV